MKSWPDRPAPALPVPVPYAHAYAVLTRTVLCSYGTHSPCADRPLVAAERATHVLGCIYTVGPATDQGPVRLTVSTATVDVDTDLLYERKILLNNRLILTDKLRRIDS
jgi:hypothetical protein